MSVKLRIFKAGSFLTLNSILVVITGLITIIFLTTNFSLAEYGIFSIIIASLFIVGGFIDSGLGSVLISDIPLEMGQKQFGRVKKLLKDYVIFQLVLAGFLSVIYVLLVLFLSILPTKEWAIISLSFFLIWTFTLKNILLIVFHSHMKFNLVLYLNQVESWIRIALIFVVIVASDFTLGNILLVYLVANIVAIAVLTPFFLKVVLYLRQYPLSHETGLISIFRKHGKYGIVISQMKSIAANIPVFIIHSFLGPASAGIFSLVNNLSKASLVFIYSLEQALLPIFSDLKHRKTISLHFVYNRTTKYVFWSSIVTFLLIIFLTDPLFPLIFGIKYIEAIFLFKFLSISVIITSISVTLRPLYFSHQAQKYLSYILFHNLIFLLVFGSILTIIFGLTGLIITLILMVVIGVFLRVVLMKKFTEIRLNVKELFIFDEYDRKLLSSFLRKTPLFKARGQES